MILRVLVALLVFLIMLVGCGYNNYEIYDYDAIVAKLKSIEVEGVVRWNSKMKNDTIIYGSPYEIYFSTKCIDSTVALNNIRLYYKDTGDMITSKSGLLEPASVEFDEEKYKWIKYYSLKNLSLVHKDLLLEIGYRQKSIDNNIAIEIKKRYRKHKVSKIEDYIRAR